MSSAMASHSIAANVLRAGARVSRRATANKATRLTVRAAASERTLPIDLGRAIPEGFQPLARGLRGTSPTPGTSAGE